MSAVAGHGQLTVDGQVVVHLAPDELSLLITACRLAESTYENAGFQSDEGSIIDALRQVSGRLAGVLR